MWGAIIVSLTGTFIATNSLKLSLRPCLSLDSAVYQLVDLYNSINMDLDNGREVRAVYLDMSKAFDKVWTRGLISKLSSNGIRGKLLKWLTEYLANRQQQVQVDNFKSSWKKIHAGVLKVPYWVHSYSWFISMI